jgi:hypothetical protein
LLFGIAGEELGQEAPPRKPMPDDIFERIAEAIVNANQRIFSKKSRALTEALLVGRIAYCVI